MNIDRYSIDHAYFDAGYHGDWWVRSSRNKHTMNYIKEVLILGKNFFTKTSYHAMENFQERGGNILIIPPTSAICWYFNENEWQDNILNYLKIIYLKKVLIKLKSEENLKNQL